MLAPFFSLAMRAPARQSAFRRAAVAHLLFLASAAAVALTRPTPAVMQPHANRLSVSHPVDMHAHAIITAPMTNTKRKPIASLRSQGIVISNSKAGSEASQIAGCFGQDAI